jgi:hypothetical protein
MGLAAGCMFASMRFFANGPSIPDELLVSRDEGDVIFFCGAGVSQAKAGLPNFEGLGRKILHLLGAAQDSPARKLLDKALDMGRIAGVGGLLATDRVFGLLEREFESSDVRKAVAEAIRPPPDYSLDAHKIMLDLARPNDRLSRWPSSQSRLTMPSGAWRTRSSKRSEVCLCSNSAPDDTFPPTAGAALRIMRPSAGVGKGTLPGPQSDRLATDALRRPTCSGDTAGAAPPQELRM